MKKIITSKPFIIINIINIILMIVLFPFLTNVIIKSLINQDYLFLGLLIFADLLFLFLFCLSIVEIIKSSCIYYLSENCKTLYKKGLFGKESKLDIENIKYIFLLQGTSSPAQYIIIENDFLKDPNTNPNSVFKFLYDKNSLLFVSSILYANQQIKVEEKNLEGTWNTFCSMIRHNKSLIKKAKKNNIKLEIIYKDSNNKNVTRADINEIDKVYVEGIINGKNIKENIYETYNINPKTGLGGKVFTRTQGYRIIKKLI